MSLNVTRQDSTLCTRTRSFQPQLCSVMEEPSGAGSCRNFVRVLRACRRLVALWHVSCAMRVSATWYSVIPNHRHRVGWSCVGSSRSVPCTRNRRRLLTVSLRFAVVRVPLGFECTATRLKCDGLLSRQEGLHQDKLDWELTRAGNGCPTHMAAAC
jgi:hypothetical protein